MKLPYHPRSTFLINYPTSILVGSSISMLNVYGINSKTLGDYHDIYLKGDVLLLADFFEKFRDTCLHNYCLDPADYYTTPGLAWDVALRMVKVTLELITDNDMYTFIENSIRGGVSMISNGYAKSNNMLNMCFQLDPEKMKSYILDLDANKDEKRSKFPVADMNTVLSSLADDDGYILEVDLEYPEALHASHNYPLAPETLKISNDMLSPLQMAKFPNEPPQ